jgi:DNA-binding NarL/FixJ family response regulator
LNIADCEGANTFYITRKLFPQSKVIIVSSIENYQLKTELIELGAEDFIIKKDISLASFYNQIVKLNIT